MHSTVSCSTVEKKYQVRKLEISDKSKGFLELLQQLTVCDSVSDQEFQNRFEELKACGDDRVVGVIEDECSKKIIATGSVFIERKFIRSCGKAGHIEDVVVDSNARGLQLGKKIVEFLTDHARSVGCYKALYSREPPRLLRLGNGHTPVDNLEESLLERDALLDQLRFHLLRAQQIMKSTADNHRREVQYSIGVKVYLKLQPYRQKSLANRPFEKLSARLYGPFEITVAYRLKLPPTSKLHPVFHVSQLKKAVGSTSDSSTLPMQLGPDLELLVEPRKY
ncbi:hypothetical protein AgCh_020705 [Apium graveolens]